ncbi:glucosaminidase domain-containing protein [Puia sp. P3]|uniref:glucosaminidase domain-containing protein n=1 Tax=Puia sp. P3 TaxID=3423952 RepID=UPI003D66F068
MKYKWFIIWVLLLAGADLKAQISANGVIYVNTYKLIAIAEMQRSGIPASIILAQGLHETEAGTSDLVKQSNNHFGIKCKEDWKGPVVYHDDDARHECFRSYATAADSYRDHSDFLKRGSRYAFLFDLDPTDYEAWAYGLRKAGYATNIRYSQILIKLIRDYNLQQYSLIAMGKIKPSEEVALTMPVAGAGYGFGGGCGGAGGSAVDSGSAGSGTYGYGGKSSGSTGAAGGQAQVSYPEGEFQINRTRVVYAQAGTSLLSIANQYSVSLPRLLEFNDMKEEDVLVKGQLLFLQRKRREGSIGFHVVRAGESLYDISQVEGVRLQDMLEMNQLTPADQPAAGEKIYLQGSAPSRPRLEGTASNKK